MVRPQRRINRDLNNNNNNFETHSNGIQADEEAMSLIDGSKIMVHARRECLVTAVARFTDHRPGQI